MAVGSGETADPLAWAKEAGRFLYRCAAGPHNAVSDDFLPHCLWHGEDCIDWYVMVPADQAAEQFGSYGRPQ